jgi:hypothetical protein
VDGLDKPGHDRTGLLAKCRLYSITIRRTRSCPNAAQGSAAPPRSVMKSRRLISFRAAL